MKKHSEMQKVGASNYVTLTEVYCSFSLAQSSNRALINSINNHMRSLL